MLDVVSPADENGVILRGQCSQSCVWKHVWVSLHNVNDFNGLFFP